MAESAALPALSAEADRTEGAGTATFARLESPTTEVTLEAKDAGRCAGLEAAKKLPSAAEWKRSKPVCSALESWPEEPANVTRSRLEDTEETVRWLADAQLRMASTVAVEGANCASNCAGVSAACGLATSASSALWLRWASVSVTDMRDAL